MAKMSKKLSIATGIFLLLAISTSMFLLPSTEARQPGWTWVSYAYLTASPNPVGVGQTVAVVMWIDAPLPGSTIQNDIRRHDYTLTITNPDGQNETQHWDAISDTTSVQYTQYTPDKAGNYTLTFTYPNQKYTWNAANTPGLSAANALYENDTFLGASKSINLEVQEEAVPQPIDSYPTSNRILDTPNRRTKHLVVHNSFKLACITLCSRCRRKLWYTWCSPT